MIKQTDKPLRVLLACEESARCREAFELCGWDAWSCDLMPSRVPGKHYQCDIREVLHDDWDLIVAFPPCDYIANSGVQHLSKEPGRGKR